MYADARAASLTLISPTGRRFASPGWTAKPAVVAGPEARNRLQPACCTVPALQALPFLPAWTRLGGPARRPRPGAPGYLNVVTGSRRRRSAFGLRLLS